LHGEESPFVKPISPLKREGNLRKVAVCREIDTAMSSESYLHLRVFKELINGQKGVGEGRHTPYVSYEKIEMSSS